MKKCVIVLLLLFPVDGFAQTQIPTCNPEVDPYECGCPLELQDKVARCEVVDVSAIPDFSDPTADKSRWMSTTWDNDLGQWKVTIDLDEAPAGPYFRPAAITFDDDGERHAWVSDFYGVPLDGNGALEPYIGVQRGIGFIFDPYTNQFTELQRPVGDNLVPGYLDCPTYFVEESSPELDYAQAYSNDDAKHLGPNSIVRSNTQTCHRVGYRGPNEPGFHSSSRMVSNSTVSARLEDEDLAEMIDAVVGDPRVVSVPEVLSSADDGTPIIDGTALEYCFNENNDPCFLDYVGQLASGKIRYIFFQDLEFAAEIRLQRWQVDNESPSAQHSVVTPFDANDVTALVVEQSQFANPSSGTPDPSNENTRLTTMGAIDSPLWHPFDLACVDLEFSNGEASVEVQTATGQYFKKSDGSYDSDSAISYLAEDVHVGGAEVYADFTITGMLSATSNLALCHNWAAFDGEE